MLLAALYFYAFASLFPTVLDKFSLDNRLLMSWSFFFLIDFFRLKGTVDLDISLS